MGYIEIVMEAEKQGITPEEFGEFLDLYIKRYFRAGH